LGHAPLDTQLGGVLLANMLAGWLRAELLIMLGTQKRKHLTKTSR
jgi:hypothetical protein